MSKCPGLSVWGRFPWKKSCCGRYIIYRENILVVNSCDRARWQMSKYPKDIYFLTRVLLPSKSILTHLFSTASYYVITVAIVWSQLNPFTRSPKSPIPAKRIASVIEYLTYAVFCYTARGFYEEHKFLFTLLLALKIDLQVGKLNRQEFDILIKGMRSFDIYWLAIQNSG